MKKNKISTLHPELKGIEHLAIAILLCDVEGHILYMNPAAESLFGLSSRQVHNMLIDEVFPHADILKLAISQPPPVEVIPRMPERLSASLGSSAIPS